MPVFIFTSPVDAYLTIMIFNRFIITLVAFHLRMKCRAMSLAGKPNTRMPTSCQGIRGTWPLSTESKNRYDKKRLTIKYRVSTWGSR